MEIEQHERSITGYRTFYQAAGEGRPVVLIHGVGGSSINYAENIAELAQHFRVYAPDIPGHGRSEKPDIPYDVESAVPFIAGFIREVCGEPAALVGMSAGGLMSALTAAEHPALVTHLVLVSSAGLGRDVGITLRLLSLPVTWPIIQNARPTPAGVRMSMRHVVHDPACLTDEMVARLVEDRSRPGNAHAMLTALRSNVGVLGLRRWRSHVRKLGKIGAPVMIVWGKQDKLIPVRHAHNAARWLGRRARVHVLDRCGHWPPYEHPAEFNRLVLEFIS
jgi:4,5:9,10-diseco-3-hydroxy-5,9,17-trioxoandrosta-1(10),2-diene-4-oate hydrolase